MIHNSSTDDVLIKKISLTVWSLRDEIESRIQQCIQDENIDLENTEAINKIIKNVQKEYTFDQLPNNIIPIQSPTLQEQEENAQLTTEEVERLATNDDLFEINKNVDIDFIPIEKLGLGKTILTEIGMDRMLFFSNKQFAEGQSIVIKFNIPSPFILHADVIYCRPFNFKSRIISKNNLTHRVLVHFTFSKPGERALLREFIKSIDATISQSSLDASQNGQNETE